MIRSCKFSYLVCNFWKRLCSGTALNQDLLVAGWVCNYVLNFEYQVLGRFLNIKFLADEGLGLVSIFRFQYSWVRLLFVTRPLHVQFLLLWVFQHTQYFCISSFCRGLMNRLKLSFQHTQLLKVRLRLRGQMNNWNLSVMRCDWASHFAINAMALLWRPRSWESARMSPIETPTRKAKLHTNTKKPISAASKLSERHFGVPLQQIKTCGANLVLAHGSRTHQPHWCGVYAHWELARACR